MEMVDHALAAVGGVLVALLGLLLGLFGALDEALRHAMSGAGLPREAQTAVIVIAGVVFAIIALRLLGGVFRVLILIFVVLLLLHMAMPDLATAPSIPT